MLSVRKQIERLFPELGEMNIVGEEMCKCGEKIQLIEMTLVAGPNKGKKTIDKKGCKCWEREMARQTLFEYEQMKKRRLMKMFDEESLINLDLKNSTFENYNPTNEELRLAKNAAIEYVKRFNLSQPENLLFTGSYGTGKSHLSVSIVRKLMEKGFNGIFICVPDLLTKLKDCYHKRSEVTEGQILDALKSADILVLDDLGAEYSGNGNNAESWAVSKIFEVINARQGKHTIYTTNLNGEEMQLKFGARNFSRVRARTRVVKMNGKDFRISLMNW